MAGALSWPWVLSLKGSSERGFGARLPAEQPWLGLTSLELQGHMEPLHASTSSPIKWASGDDDNGSS